jgi:hypothetical protein
MTNFGKVLFPLSARQRSGEAFAKPQSQLQAVTPPEGSEFRCQVEIQRAVHGTRANEDQHQVIKDQRAT